MKRKNYFYLFAFIAAMLSVSFASCNNDDEEVINNIPSQAVDLGLPSGTLWARYNIGATAPEEYGDYFAWGETEGFRSGKKEFGLIDEKGQSLYKWIKILWEAENPVLTLTKYNNNVSKGEIDNKMELDIEDDAAYKNWGDGWRMPSYEQFKELISNCEVKWTIINGVKGRKITSKTNGNFIFLPAAGKREQKLLEDEGGHGYYWSRTLNDKSPSAAYDMEFGSNDLRTSYSNLREDGLSVRPVRMKP